MEDIRLYVSKILRNYFDAQNVAVFPEEYISDDTKLPDEYITYCLANEVYSAYANNRPIWKKSSVDITYHCKNINNKLFRCAEIEKVMWEADGKPSGIQIDLPREVNAKYYGVLQEWSFYRMVK